MTSGEVKYERGSASSMCDDDNIVDIARRLLVKCENANSGGLQNGLFRQRDSQPIFQHTVSVTGCCVTFRIGVSGLSYSPDDTIEMNTTITKGEALYWLGLLGYKREHLMDIDTERKELFESNISNCAVGSVDSQAGITDNMELMEDMVDIKQEVNGLPNIKIKQEPLSDNEVHNHNMQSLEMRPVLLCQDKVNSDKENTQSHAEINKDIRTSRMQKTMRNKRENITHGDKHCSKKIKLEKDAIASSEIITNESQVLAHFDSQIIPTVKQHCKGLVGCNLPCEAEAIDIETTSSNDCVVQQGQSSDKCEEFAESESTNTLESSEERHRYACRMCVFRCNASRSLKQHMAIHLPSDLYKCTKCEYSCRKCYQLTEHMVAHEQEKAYRCVYCTFETKKSTKLQTHMSTHTESRRYRCSKCNFTCKKCVVLKEHYMNEHKHTNTHSTYQCTICEQGFQDTTDFKFHMEQHIPSKLYKCYKCDFECKKCINLKKHVKIHKNEDCVETMSDVNAQETAEIVDKLDDQSSQTHREMRRNGIVDQNRKCTICAYTCKWPSDLRRHMMIHSGEKPFSCDICAYTCARSENLTIHLRTHSGEKPFQCTLCPYKSAASNLLKKHLLTHRKGIPRLRCETCSYSTSSMATLTLHKKKHEGNGELTCDHCDYTTKITSHFRRHIRIHTQDKPYKCNICRYSSTNSSDLKRHKRIHSNEKTFKCTHPACSYKSVYRCNLIVHERIHTGVRPYKCTMCPYTATQSGSLVIHTRRHTKERPYSCELCHYKSADSSTLKRHIRQVHNKNTNNLELWST